MTVAEGVILNYPQPIITIAAMDSQRQQALGLALLALLIVLLVLLRRWWGGA